MTSIFAMPLSMGPVKSVCGLTRLMTMAASIESRSVDAQIGEPNRLRPTSTASMEESTGAPMLTSFTPRSARTRACPSAVAEP